ncbi:Hypothetical protein CINCED_3A015296 [Cinara cedri]|uniref:Uncharacterized protein n=1 Tax=Cinara cedri TaxID=506608 RepID=A0A5E4NK21_9HEMI|nr:Hypothetical protein CINCED_3A015296 [Cinara cedri]
MQAIRIFLVVSILLFCDWVYIPGPSTVTLAMTPTTSSIITILPDNIKTKADAFIRTIQNVQTSLKSPSNNHQLNPRPMEVITDIQLPNYGFFDVYKNDDNICPLNPQIYLNALNGSLVGLLIHKISTWMKASQPLEYYLGHIREHVILIDRAISRIAYEKRSDINDKLNLNDTIKLFYVTCDIQNTTNGNENQLEYKRRLFQDYMLKYKIDNELLTNESLNYFANTMRESLNIIKDVHSWFKVSIPLMKNYIYLMDYPKNDDFNKLQNMQVPNGYASLNSLVQSYLNESNVVQIEKNHLNVLRIVAPELFSYLYEHFNILIKLFEHGISRNEQSEIWRFHLIPYTYINLFLSRIIEFERDYVGIEEAERGKMMLESIESLAVFLDPYLDDSPDTQPRNKKLKKKITEIPKEDTLKLDEDIIPVVSKMINDATKILLQYFDKNIDKWMVDRILKPEKPYVLNKTSLLLSLKDNYDKASDTFKKYDKYTYQDFVVYTDFQKNNITESENKSNLISEFPSDKPTN